MFTAARDALASKAAQTFINQRIGRYGEVQRLKLDSKNKTAEVVCRLNGESAPVSIRVEDYRIFERDGKSFVRIGQCACDRLWLQNLLSDFGTGREFPVPPWAASAL